MFARPRPLVVVRKRPSPIPSMVRSTARLAAAGELVRGPALARFEGAVAQRLVPPRASGASALDSALKEGVAAAPAVAAVSSGRFALLLVLRALGIHPPATVLVPSYNASCVPNILQAAGYGLHFVDIDAAHLHLDPERLPPEPPPGAEAVVVTHIEGNPGPVEAVSRWARPRGLKVIEDAAHALGGRVGERPVGTLGDGAIFSLGRGKLLNTLGGGLAVVSGRGGGEAATRLGALAAALPGPPPTEIVRQVLLEAAVRVGTSPAVFTALVAPLLAVARRLDRDPMAAAFEDSKDALPGVPPALQRRLSNLQARFGLDGLARFDRDMVRRRGHAATLRAALGPLSETGALSLQEPRAGTQPAWLELTALVDGRDAFQRALLARGVDSQRTWMDACDALPAFAGASGGPCPVAREAARRALYLPTYPELTHRDVTRVGRAVAAVLSARAAPGGRP